MMYRLIASCLLVCVALPAFAQPTCTPATTTQNAARDEARMVWVPPTLNTDNTAIGSPLTYRVYRSSGAGNTSFAVQCQTTAVTVSLLAQPVGVQNYRVTVQYPGSLESAPTNPITRTVLAPTPNPPSGLSFLEQLVAWLRSFFGRFV